MADFKTVVLGETYIDVSGIKTKVTVLRNSSGNLEMLGINDEGKFPDGTCTEGWNEEIIITKYVPC